MEPGDTITLVDEDELEHSFEVADIVEVDEQTYFVLVPQDRAQGADEAGKGSDEEDEDEEGTQAVIMRVDEDEDGDQVLSEIEDDAEFERVLDALKAQESEDEDDDEDEEDELDGDEDE
ncbi:MAG: DUF1292 domain-containing protein, partial [Limnochordaceae bacterium]|nr:DUF1292 domain-containing protein [Limnochordaceae bacterium]